MKFLKELNRQTLIEKTDLTELPEVTIKELQKMVRIGAEQSGQWVNALELCNKAYNVLNIQIPTPDMENAWKQYETMIAYSVEQLGKHHGKKGTWRMTSESMVERDTFDVILHENGNTTELQVKAYDTREIVDFITEDAEYYDYTTKTKEVSSKSTVLEFWKHGIIKKKIKVSVNKTYH